MAPMRDRKVVDASHEPSRLRVGDPRSGPRLCEAQRFMVPTRDCEVVEASHEPQRGLPTLQRLTQFRFMGREQVRKEHGASHEPQKVAQASCLSGLTGWKPVPLYSRRPGSWPQLTSYFGRCSLSMNRVGRDSVEP